MACDGPVHFVLHGLEELDADRLRRIVVDTGSVDVSDFLVKAPLGGADVLNPPQQLVEIIERLVGIFQAFVVEDETLDDEFTQFLRGPDAKARGQGAFNAVADGDDGVEVVMLHRAGHLSVSLLSNY